MDAAIDERRLKELLKRAVAEVLEERKDLLQDALTEVIEDISLSRAISEGEKSGFVSRQEVFEILDSEE